MNSLFLRSKGRDVAAVCLLATGTLLLGQLCRGQGLPSSVLGTSPGGSVNKVKWISGPQKVSLGTVAEIQIPQGYRLTDAEGARALLADSKNPLPQGLIAVLSPDSGTWWAVLEYTETGYVKDADKEKLDAQKILKS